MRPLEVVADGCAVEHNDVGHNPARSGVADRLVPTRSSTVAPRSGSACGARRTASWPPSATAVTDLPTRSPVSCPLTDTSSAGLGLWLTHQLSSHVTLDTTDDGFTIRLIVGTPQPGRSGHAPDTA